ncbi:Vegetative incompatibility protein HET-E-1 like [Verticillium longisporum]|nr:Vegetative incompatibility protein HET-E-1 like [Verticillium longisporum]
MIQRYSVAARMRWAANRDTTRKEDIAYCLLGLFDINMPLLYGEREKAFARLQEEIVRRNPEDQSILAWIWKGPENYGLATVFADSPSNFYLEGNILIDKLPWKGETKIIPTPRGVEIDAILLISSQPCYPN